MRTPCAISPFLFPQDSFSSEDLQSEKRRRFSPETDFIAPETAFTWRLGAELNNSHAEGVWVKICSTAEQGQNIGILFGLKQAEAVFFWELKTF